MTAHRPYAYSMPVINKNRSNITSPIKNQEERSPEIRAAWAKLPTVKIGNILRKIGAVDRHRQMFVPNEEDQAEFKKKKWDELRRHYSPHRYVNKQPFEGELDDIVLGCYSYGQNLGRRTVWRKYRQNCDMLSFDTLKVIKKKK